MYKDKELKVSIICVTYNHAKYIEQAINSFVNQKTSFKIKVYIHDDASTDGTDKIIMKYYNDYPEIIVPILQKENQYSKGESVLKNIFPLIDTEYVAFCEGDDYWVDENKLEKQIKFLEKNEDYSMSFHYTKVIYEDNATKESLQPSMSWIKRHPKRNFSLLLTQNFIATSSVVYRWGLSGVNLNLMRYNLMPTDWFLHLFHAKMGKIKFIPDVMSVYRKHSGGVWYNAERNMDWVRKNWRKSLNFYECVDEVFKYKNEEKLSFYRAFEKYFQQNQEPSFFYDLLIPKLFSCICIGDLRKKFNGKYKAAKLIKEALQKPSI